jgi:hypothetical protein
VFSPFVLVVVLVLENRTLIRKLGNWFLLLKVSRDRIHRPFEMALMSFHPVLLSFMNSAIILAYNTARLG